MKKNNKKDLKCFIITPVPTDDGDLSREYSGIINHVVKPVCKKNNFSSVFAAHEISSTGSITRSIIKNIYDADIVVANLTGFNANVMYELAVSHAFKKKVITILRSGVQLPFDIKDDRTIYYKNDIYGQGKLVKDFEDTLLTVLSFEDDFTDNPIFNSIKLSSLIDDDDFKVDQNQLLLQIIDMLNDQSRNSRVTKSKSLHEPPYNYFDVEITTQTQLDYDEEIHPQLQQINPNIEFSYKTDYVSDTIIRTECRSFLSPINVIKQIQEFENDDFIISNVQHIR